MTVACDNFRKRCDLLGPKVVKALQGRRFGAHYFPTGEEAVKMALSLIPEGATVSWGGSVTIGEIGLLDAVKKVRPVIDRDAAPDREARFEAMRRSLTCDVFLTSANAISEDGQLVNVDNVGNRVAAMTFGPKRVIVVAGMNKVCKTLNDAVVRARTYASPINVVRLNVTKTPCAVTGSCADCQAEECLCSHVVTTRMNKIPDRMHVILVGQSLGF